MKTRWPLGLLSAAVLTACATTSSIATRPSATAPPRAAIAVHETFAQQIDQGCTYRATVQGVLEPAGASASGSTAERYRPDLRVDAELACPAVAHEATHGAVRGDPLTRAETEQAVQNASRVTVAMDGITCFYEATFRLSGQGLTGQSLARWCRIPPPARGGGPLAAAPPHCATPEPRPAARVP